MKLADVRAALEKRESVTDVTKRIMTGITTAESGPEKLNAFISFDYVGAMAAAEAITARVANGDALPLAGVPVAVKDNICSADFPTTCGSRILANFTPPYDATCVARLRAAGAIVPGKTNLDEFAMGSSTETSAFGRTRNPHDPKRVTGGSSGGSAAAVAARLVPVALGTDTAGSVRQPAAFCGVVGFKPSYGRISRYGLIAYASSLDTIGIFASAVRDAAEIYQVIAGADSFDATSSARAVEPMSVAEHLEGVVVGVPREYFTRHLDRAVRERCGRVIRKLQRAGAEIREVTLPHTRFAIPAYYAISTAEACSNLARYDGVRYGVRARDAGTLAQLYHRTRSIGFGSEVKRRILLGLHVLSETPRTALTRAQHAARLIAGELDAVFESGVDLLFTPTAPTPAFVAGEKTNPYELYLSDMFTVPANLSGIPAISIPIGNVDGMPVGGQLLARRWHDAELLSAGAVLEQMLS